jgi:hypothetical protein
VVAGAEVVEAEAAVAVAEASAVEAAAVAAVAAVDMAEAGAAAVAGANAADAIATKPPHSKVIVQEPPPARGFLIDLFRISQSPFPPRRDWRAASFCRTKMC